ncbi:Iron/zinc purple acid phosphatase-like protein [Leptotrombidium deliense]|uniref:Purple acid phosphatase n=1 Tax=Leptotrombidium deliense TaxID=299467 RepID=A0A443SQC7_9ACAR|nr:Iron/zinc purple acid phosphatase-like protein [Leptotrombidium deliense]
MTVTWVTLCPSKEGSVQYGTPLIDKSTNASVTKFEDGGKRRKVIYVYRAFLTDLIPGQKYFVGDLGLENGQSVPSLIDDVMNEKIDFVIHNGWYSFLALASLTVSLILGDIAYDMHSKNGKVGNEFMRKIEAIAANVAYMTTPGNHEETYNFSHYENRFTMIDWNTGKMNNHYYSFKAGPVLIICFSTEFYYSTYYNEYHIRTQYEWLKSTLQKANQPENRLLQPWIITVGHQPMYCTMKNVALNHDCTNKRSKVRKGIGESGEYGLEYLFYKHGVDLQMWAHEHSYERLWPVYDSIVLNGSILEPYTNPKAPVHLISGGAGNFKGFDEFSDVIENWSALRVNDYGYTIIEVINVTHTKLVQYSVVEKIEFDEFYLVKDVHGSYEKL